ncbi:hypothetical protein Dimus_018322, partial [Dionaea muscipula]
PKAEPRPKKDVVSPTVEENKVDAKAGDDGGSQSDKAVEEGIQTVDVDIPVVNMNMEGQTRKRRQKQVVRTGLAAKTDKEKVSLVEVETEPIKEPVVSESPTIEEMDQQVDELLARPFVFEAVHEEVQEEQRDGEEVLEIGEEEGKGKGDVGPSTSKR